MKLLIVDADGGVLHEAEYDSAFVQLDGMTVDDVKIVKLVVTEEDED